jgi:hypothetical protein
MAPVISDKTLQPSDESLLPIWLQRTFDLSIKSGSMTKAVLDLNLLGV